MELFEMSEKTRDAVQDFLLAHEGRCVALTERVLRNVGRTFYLAKNVREPFIAGVISVSKSGTVLHCLPFAAQLSAESRNRIGEATEIFAPFFAENPIFCISGDAAGSALLENAMRLSASQNVLEAHAYYRMEYDEERDTIIRRAEEKKVREDNHAVREERVQNYGLSVSADSALDSSDDDTVALRDTGTIVKCTVRDVSSLLPLQMAYDKTEVLLQGMEADEDECRLRLTGQLKLQDVFADVIGGEFVAKAGTNARGVNWVQLGGVYTKPLYRRLGIAARLVSHAAQFAAAQGKQTTLFVKELNTRAFHSYERAGFVRRGAYRIIYYDGYDE